MRRLALIAFSILPFLFSYLPFCWARSSELAGKDTTSVTVGAVYWMHYSRAELNTTVPQEMLWGFQVSKLVIEDVELYGSFARSLSPYHTQLLSVGTKYDFMSFVKRHGLFRAVTVQLVVDATYFSVAAPVAPKTYSSSALIPRVGGAFEWDFDGRRWGFTTALLATRVSDNIFLAPSAGFTFHF